MFEDFLISRHIMKRYRERADETIENVKRKINKDLKWMKVKKIINKGNHRHVFTTGSKEFIFKNDAGTWILKTIIKYNRDRFPLMIKKRIAS